MQVGIWYAKSKAIGVINARPTLIARDCINAISKKLNAFFHRCDS